MSIIKRCGDVLSINRKFRVKRKYNNLRLIIIGTDRIWEGNWIYFQVKSCSQGIW